MENEKTKKRIRRPEKEIGETKDNNKEKEERETHVQILRWGYEEIKLDRGNGEGE